jgi:hypothetical protein
MKGAYLHNNITATETQLVSIASPMTSMSAKGILIRFEGHLGYNTVWSVQKWTDWGTCFQADIMLRFFFDSENGGDIILRDAT